MVLFLFLKRLVRQEKLLRENSNGMSQHSLIEKYECGKQRKDFKMYMEKHQLWKGEKI